MNQVYEDLSAVVNRFPEHSDAVNLHFKRNTAFRTMCEDYRKCRDALSYWKRLNNTGACEGICKEYEALLNELEVEILQAVKEKTF